MNNTKNLILFILCSLLLYATTNLAQSNSNTQNTPPPCSAPEAAQFDFWVGEWDLTWKGGKGTNVIRKMMNGCVIEENFDGTPAIQLKGMSVSTYNPTLKKWQQTWVDNSGSYLDFTGEFKDGKMVLSRPARRNGKDIIQRMTWYNIEENELDWDWEFSQDDGKTWQLQWRIHYVRKGSKTDEKANE